MRLTVVRSIALALSCLVAVSSALATNCGGSLDCYVTGSYEFTANAFDNQFRSTPFPVLPQPTSAMLKDPNVIVSGNILPLQYYDASAAIGYHIAAKFGQLSVGVTAVANATHSTNFNQSVRSFANVVASAAVDDTLNFKVGFPDHPNNRLINATMFLRISGGLTAKADGEYKTSGSENYIDASAFSTLEIGGTEIEPAGPPFVGPYALYFGYYDDEMVSSNTFNPHIALDPPQGFFLTLHNVTPYQDTSVFYSMRVVASASVVDLDLENTKPGAANASADFSHTVTYGGIVSVTDAETGEPINDWSVTSASGFDWSQPYQAPEPSSLVCGMAAILFLTPARIRRTVA